MEFAEFAARAEEIAEEPGDLATTERVRDLLADASEDLPVVVRFLQGRVYPAWDATTLDIGPALLHEAIARAAGPNVDSDDVESKLAEVGEIGAVAATYEFGGQRGLGAFGGGAADGSGERGGGLTVAAVDDRLREIATTTGEGSEGRRLDALFGLFNRASQTEAKFLARLVLGEMRIGVGGGTVRDATAAAFVDEGVAGEEGETPSEAPGADESEATPDSDAVDAVERALQVSNDYGMVARVAREEGREGLDAVGLEVGRPVQAMLAQAGTVTDALDDWETTGVEWKYDGARVQVHYDGESVTLYSRNMEDVTDPLPEIVDAVETALDRPAILDGEVVAVDGEGDPLPFQEVLRRFRRKHDVAKAREDVAVRLHAFDCLHADGRDLLDAPLVERRDALGTLLDGSEAIRSTFWLEDETDAIESIAEDALAAGHEGIMLKDPDSTYAPGDRGKHWRKRKPDVETLDLVVTGAEWGEGRRATFLGTFELGARTDDGYATVGNVATGITDEQLADLTDLLEPHVTREDGQMVDIDPAVVFEVGYEEIQTSSTYESGYALRFPRFVDVRSDVRLDDADSLERVERLAAQQG